MEHMAELLGMALVLGIPITAILTYHQRKMAEIKARMGSAGTDEIKRELVAIRQEMAELRDTSTKFDVSFDAAITRLEQRMDRTDEVLQTALPKSYSQTNTDSDITLQVKR